MNIESFKSERKGVMQQRASRAAQHQLHELARDLDRVCPEGNHWTSSLMTRMSAYQEEDTLNVYDRLVA